VPLRRPSSPPGVTAAWRRCTRQGIGGREARPTTNGIPLGWGGLQVRKEADRRSADVPRRTGAADFSLERAGVPPV
jgi:hypothetical protein